MSAANQWTAQGVKNGILASVFTMAAFSVVYAISPRWMLSLGWYWGSMVIYLVFMYRAGATAGGASFKDYVRAPFLVFVIANLFFYAFFYVLFTFVDAGLYDIQADMLEKAGRLEKPADKSSLIMSLGSVFRAYMNSLVGGFIVSAGIAVVLQNR